MSGIAFIQKSPQPLTKKPQHMRFSVKTNLSVSVRLQTRSYSFSFSKHSYHS